MDSTVSMRHLLANPPPETLSMITVQFLLTALVVVLAPGTGVIYTLALGLGQGRRAALWAAMGCTIGIVPHLAAATLGLAAVLHTSALLFTAVKWAGAAYLLYLAWQSMKDGGALSVSPTSTRQNGWQIARRGALINILNPKLSIFFLALLPPFLSGNPTSATVEMAMLGAVFMVMTFAVFVLYGIFAAAARQWFLGSARVMTWLNRSFAAIFAALAGRLALEHA
jgi:threonine/homoserine/homoserine lactone efflux protein